MSTNPGCLCPCLHFSPPCPYHLACLQWLKYPGKCQVDGLCPGPYVRGNLLMLHWCWVYPSLFGCYVQVFYVFSGLRGVGKPMGTECIGIDLAPGVALVCACSGSVATGKPSGRAHMNESFGSSYFDVYSFGLICLVVAGYLYVENVMLPC